MIDRKAIEDIFAQYKKHGWVPRRVLQTGETKENMADLDALFPGADVRSSDLDAVWFSRSSRPGMTAWEIRRLAGSPFALVVVVQDSAGPEELEAALRLTELRMLESAPGPSSGY